MLIAEAVWRLFFFWPEPQSGTFALTRHNSLILSMLANVVIIFACDAFDDKAAASSFSPKPGAVTASARKSQRRRHVQS